MAPDYLPGGGKKVNIYSFAPAKKDDPPKMGQVPLLRGYSMANSPDKDSFLHPKSHYYGDFKPEKLVFNANLQEFAQRVSFICNLETAGKMETVEAYEQIKRLWKKLRDSKRELGIGEDPFHPSDVGDDDD